MLERLCSANNKKKSRTGFDLRSYYLSSNQTATDVIAEDIIYLAVKLKTHSCDVSVSNIVARNGQYRKKVLTFNLKMNDLYK